MVLRKGHLYLIPSYISCSYSCPEYMEHYYATFTALLPNQMSVYHLYNFRNVLRATPFHYELFEKLKELNKGMGLPTADPKVYQKKGNLGVRTNEFVGLDHVIKTSGLLHLLLADFIEGVKMNMETESHLRIAESFKYIHLHLNENLTVDKLAKQSCMSSDHFTRLFRELTGQTPINYINRQRVERAQLLLDTTSDSISDIAYQCGFKCNTYFSKVFRKYLGQTPSTYRARRFGTKKEMMNSNLGRI